MAKKTLEQYHDQSDAANGLKRTLLSINANRDEIQYETGPTSHMEPIPPQVPQEPMATPEATSDVPQVTLDVLVSESVPDIPITALDSVKALLAQTLKKPESEIKDETTVKSLSNGRSRVQNEIMGDMLEEFGSLPDDAENAPIQELASTIQKGYDGKMRKCLRARTGKMMASKMPGSFSLTVLRSHLSKKWGLGPGRQDAVLLKALSQQPVARINNTEDAETYFDGVAQMYMDSVGLKRPTGNATGGKAKQVMFDSEVLDRIRSEHTVLKRRIASLLTDSDIPIPSSSTTQDMQSDVETKVDMLETELGDDFCNGIKPIFNAEQARLYDSTWNWAHVDLLVLVYKYLVKRDTDIPTPKELISMKEVLRNRWSPRLQRSYDYLRKSLSARTDRPAEATKTILENIKADELLPASSKLLGCDGCDRAESCSILQAAKQAGFDNPPDLLRTNKFSSHS